MVEGGKSRPATKLPRRLLRALLLRCPRCGAGRLFQGLRMREACDSCQLQFEREPGFYLGSIYFNYGLTSVLATVGFLVIRFGLQRSNQTALTVTVAFAVLFPLLLHRHARSFWLAFDELIDPQQERRRAS